MVTPSHTASAISSSSQCLSPILPKASRPRTCLADGWSFAKLPSAQIISPERNRTEAPRTPHERPPGAGVMARTKSEALRRGTAAFQLLHNKHQRFHMAVKTQRAHTGNHHAQVRNHQHGVRSLGVVQETQMDMATFKRTWKPQPKHAPHTRGWTRWVPKEESQQGGRRRLLRMGHDIR